MNRALTGDFIYKRAGRRAYSVYRGQERIGQVTRELRADEAVSGQGPTTTTWIARSRFANASGVGSTRDEAVRLMLKCEQELPA